jgi:uncharacterized protein YbjT (DUF2867 family)
MNSANKRLVLVTGATGYVGGRLATRLIARGEQIRCLVRRPEALVGHLSAHSEVVQGDLLDAPSLDRALTGVDTAYYLVHSLGTDGDFEAEEAEAALNFALAAKAAAVRRTIYLGGLCEEGRVDLSPHLRSRRRVGEILREHGVQTIEFRASVILGSGSLSFELIRTLVQRLPIMVTPKWVSVQAQPISISDVLEYLAAALDLEVAGHRIYEIGGLDQMSYGDLMRDYARIRGLRRWMIAVPVLTPRLSSLWLNLVTPVYARIGRKLIDSMTSPSIVRDDSALRDFDIRPTSVHEAIEQALRNEDREVTETHWTGAVSTVGPVRTWSSDSFLSRIIDYREAHTKAHPEQAYALIQRIGGVNGWYYGNWLWRLRGFLDRLVGGVGMGRGRRDPESLRVGDVVDCWRVESFDPPRRLSLVAEMKLPGRAWLQFDVEPDGAGSRIRQTAIYDPLGLSGIFYWYLLYPVHKLVFAGMLRNIVRVAERGASR